jgi:hypothetical protein
MAIRKILNPGRLLADPQYWGIDPVHPTISGYKKVVNYLVTALDNQNKSGALATPAQKRPAEGNLAGPCRRPFWVSDGNNNNQEWAMHVLIQ